LCALTSACGSFAYTCGVEWLAAEKIDVHGCSGLAWGSADNLIAELGRLSQLLAAHPCFFDGARLTRLSPSESPVYALRRESDEGLDRVLVLVNTDVAQPQTLILNEGQHRELGEPSVDLLGQAGPRTERLGGGGIRFTLAPGACHCLAAQPEPRGLSGDAYRFARAQAAWVVTALGQILPEGQIGGYHWKGLADLLARLGPERFLASLTQLDCELAQEDLMAALEHAASQTAFPTVVVWDSDERRRVLMVPPDHWLLVREAAPFRASLHFAAGGGVEAVASIMAKEAHWVCFPPNRGRGDARLILERFVSNSLAITKSRSIGNGPSVVEGAWPEGGKIEGQLRFLSAGPDLSQLEAGEQKVNSTQEDLGLVLLTNGIGGMARLGIDLGRIKSKYDCLLAANLHSEYPVDRHVFAKRARVWVNADRFLTVLDWHNLVEFTPGPPARWRFVANAGDGRSVEIHLTADMLSQRNVTVMRFSRPRSSPPRGVDLPEQCEVSLTVRIDIEDRNFHTETHHNGGAEYHFNSLARPLTRGIGFEFAPAPDRCLRVSSDVGQYHHESEWCDNIAHPVEQVRGQVGAGDAFSPGWFELPLPKGAEVTLLVAADRTDIPTSLIQSFETDRRTANESALSKAEVSGDDAFGRMLALAIQAFIARRNDGKTVIAGYPWFLDWGRDSLICARGLLAAGMIEEVKQLLAVFGRFEDGGTLPNSIHGADASNRDTSDAPLWYAIVCEEVAAQAGPGFYTFPVDHSGRMVSVVLQRIAAGYIGGTPNGIRMDPVSGLIWSPKHFTWMDTNHPAGSPREGYPVEIQVLWIRLLRQLDRLSTLDNLAVYSNVNFPPSLTRWRELADRAENSFHRLYWLEERGYLADLLLASSDTPASAAVVDNALRSNYLLAISLDLVTGTKAQRAVEAARRHLIVPGATRSLAPLPVSPLLPVRATDGRLLNDPAWPYWGRYEGDEDTRRKPAYHNGTAWTWTFPIFCEALVKAWSFAPAARAAAQAYLGSMDRLLQEGCLGHLPEIVDGDAPHTQRGCDAQAWGATEAFRVWKFLRKPENGGNNSGSRPADAAAGRRL
jgi:starch synthase (maltosyl-transferring)